MPNSGRVAVLAFVDAVMERTLAAHEKLCDQDECSVENPCPYCQINEILMSELAKLK